MQLAFYFDQSRCTGCFTCVVACKDWHDIPAGLVSWRKILTIEKEKYPDVFVAFFSASCYHCAEPACVKVCPTNAVKKREESGVVVVDRETCLGKDSCELCKEACPYDIPQFGAEGNAKMQKCNFCPDRLAENKKPICVGACPNRALDFGDLAEMKTKYGGGIEAEGFVYSPTKPAIVLRPHWKGVLGKPEFGSVSGKVKP